MVHTSHEEFNQIVANAIDAIPEKYAKHINNLAFVVEDYPTDEQRRKLRLRSGETLFGLYEGIPLTSRNNGYNLVLPDKITVFKQPLEAVSQNLSDLNTRVRKTIWHEVAHYYGLGHTDMDALEAKKHPKKP